MTGSQLLISAMVTIGIDQATKVAATGFLDDARFYGIEGLAGFRRVNNWKPRSLVSLWAHSIGLLLVVTLVCLIVALLTPAEWTEVGVGMVIGGAVGNLLDRVFREGVVDFISIGRWQFNFADSAMACGILLVVWSFL